MSHCKATSYLTNIQSGNSHSCYLCYSPLAIPTLPAFFSGLRQLHAVLWLTSEGDVK